MGRVEQVTYRSAGLRCAADLYLPDVADDVRVPETQAAYARAGEPKRLDILPFDAMGFYSEPGTGEARAPAKSKNGLAPAGHFAGSPPPNVVNDPFIASDDMNESFMTSGQVSA